MTVVENDALITALFGAFATFTAFGAAVAGFVAAGGVVQALASWWAQHGKVEALEDARSSHKLLKALASARKRTPGTMKLVAVFIVVVIVISGAGLVISSIWLYAYSHGPVSGVSWAYSWTVDLFLAEVPLLTIATAAAVVAAAGSAISASNLAESTGDLDDAVRDAAIRIEQARKRSQLGLS